MGSGEHLGGPEMPAEGLWGCGTPQLSGEGEGKRMDAGLSTAFLCSELLAVSGQVHSFFFLSKYLL